MKPVYVSFYTPDYEDCAIDLMMSLETFGLSSDVQAFKDLGTWLKNCAAKPKYIWQMMSKHEGHPIVWIDADAVVRRRPELFDSMEADLGVVRYEWPAPKRVEILSGTVYVANNIKAHRLVDAWIEECADKPDIWDQKCLENAMERIEEKVKVTYLPISYAFISDTHRKKFPGVEPVIEHFQRSRRTRSKRIV